MAVKHRRNLCSYLSDFCLYCHSRIKSDWRNMMAWELPINYRELSPQERRSVRHQYISEQAGLCYWCKQPLASDPPKEIMNKKIQFSLFPANFLKHPIHLQHCHKTGMTEGAVHSRCNAIMWQEHGR